MDMYLERIKKHIDEEHYGEALRRSNSLIRCKRGSDNEEDKARCGAVVQIIRENGVPEKVLNKVEECRKHGRSIPFGPIYELYKFEIHAYGDVSLRTLEGLYAFYASRDDRMTKVGLSATLLEQYRKEGRDDLIADAEKRLEENIQLLRERAAYYQETGEHRYAFNSYRYLLEGDFDCYEYHLGYLFNAIKSGKPEEAYKTILKDKAHRDYILGDANLQGLFYDLAHVVVADEDRPDVLQ